MDIGKYLGASWNLIVRHPVPIMLGALVAAALGAASLGLLTGPMYAGVSMLFVGAAAGRTPEVGEVFKYLNRTLPMIVATIVIGILTAIGLCLLVIPGLVMLGWWSYVPLLIADRGLGVRAAMDRSRAMVRAEGVVNHLLFLLVLFIVGAAGSIVAGIGALFTLPLAGGALALAYADRRDR